MTATGEIVKMIIAEKLEMKPHSISIVPESNIKDDLGADSLEYLDIIVELESKFKIVIDAREANKAYTVKQLCRLVENKIEKQFSNDQLMISSL